MGGSIERAFMRYYKNGRRRKPHSLFYILFAAKPTWGRWTEILTLE